MNQSFGNAVVLVRVSGKPVLGMCVTGIGAVTIIILDAVFIIVFDWGVIGAASATVIGQIFSALFGAYFVFGNRTQVKISKDIFLLKKELCMQIISCGFAFWAAQMAMGFISLVYNSQLGKYGSDIAISVYAVISTLCQAAIFSVSITCFIWIIVLVFPKQILAAFGGIEEMLRIGISGLLINFCITPGLRFVSSTICCYNGFATAFSILLILKEKKE